jgi:hypothetical protein
MGMTRKGSQVQVLYGPPFEALKLLGFTKLQSKALLSATVMSANMSANFFGE